MCFFSFSFFPFVFFTKPCEATLFTGTGSYNSFRQQVGFCKLQGFDTVSRSTSTGPLAFQSQHIFMGVGMNQIQFQHDISQCGRCLSVETIKPFPLWNAELTEWTWENSSSSSSSSSSLFPLIMMIMDECQDPICQSGYLDFDIYSTIQPVNYGNPTFLQWSYIRCPTVWKDIEFLFCLSSSCHETDPKTRTVGEVISMAEPYFWSLFLRNAPLPIYQIMISSSLNSHKSNTSHEYALEYELENVVLEKKEGWFWNAGKFQFQNLFYVTLILSEKDDDGLESIQCEIDFSSWWMTLASVDYRGGILLPLRSLSCVYNTS